MEIIELDSYFVGKGSKKSMIFNQISFCSVAYLYEINSDGQIHYEVFKRRTNAVCLDFEKRLYSDTIFKESYPRDESFGVWAWTTKSLERANVIFKDLDNGGK